MPGKHKDLTIAFRPTATERAQIEAKQKVSGLNKREFYIRSCIYNHICVVGSKENVLMLVNEMKTVQNRLEQLLVHIKENESEYDDYSNIEDTYIVKVKHSTISNKYGEDNVEKIINDIKHKRFQNISANTTKANY